MNRKKEAKNRFKRGKHGKVGNTNAESENDEEESESE